MFDRIIAKRLTTVLPSALLVVAVAAGATSDSRLVEAARNQDVKTIRSLISQHADVNAEVGRRLDSAALGRALERS